MFLDFSTADKRVRSVALLEGLSYIVLGVAMIVKRVADKPEAIKIPGYVHGILFVILLFGIISLLSAGTWKLKKAATVFALSLLPIGAFVAEYLIRKEERDAK